MRGKIAWLACASVTALVGSGAAWAQTAPQPAAPAASAAPSSEQMGDIVVTAQKREQKLQDVPASISAVAGVTLQNAKISDVQALQVAVPNITIGTSFGFANLFIRGLGLNSVFANVDPSVTLYEDGAVISQPAAQLFSFFDLERVEVLRGPQGTLYGRNATGGTINLITAKPTDTLSGFVRLDAGNYSSLEAEGGISGPITDTLSARVSFYIANRDGFGKNLTTGHDVNDLNTRSLRAQLRFRPSADFDTLFVGEYGRENDAANALQFKRETFPGVLTDSNPANNGLASPGVGGFPNSGNPRDYASAVDPANRRRTWSITNVTHWNVNDILTLTNTLNYRKFYENLVQDLDLSATVTSSINDFVVDSKHLSEELQATVNLDRLDLITGFYLFSEDLYHQNAIAAGAKAGEFTRTTPGNGRRVFLTGNGDTDTWALYWNATFKLTPTINIKGGGRYTTDRRKIDNENYIWVPNAGGVLPPLPLPQVARVQTYDPTLDDKKTFHAYTNEAGVEWHPTRDIMVYYSYAEGFKAGTGQLGTTQVARPLIIRPEKIRNHEIGLKSEFDGGRLVFNISAYTYKVKDVQLDRTVPGGPSGFTTVFENATSQKARGIELDTSWRPSPVFRGNLSMALQDTKFGSFLSVDPTNPLIFDVTNPALRVDIDGNPARNAPKLAGSLRLEYDIPLANGGRFTLSGDGSYKSRQYFSEFKNSLLSEGGYSIFNAGLRYAFPNRRWTASIWAKNLTDKLAEQANFALATARVVGRTFTAPRTYGVGARYNF